MEVRLNAAVEKVIVENRTARAIQLSDGTVISAKIIVSDINSKKLYTDKIDQNNISRAGQSRLQKLPLLHGYADDLSVSGLRPRRSKTIIP